MDHDLAAVVRRYDEVWADRDVARRREILAAIWTDDSVYLDPDVPDGLVGPDALVDFIEASFEQYPGLAVTATSEVAVLRDRAWYRWRQTSDGAQAINGTDFIEFDADGRIQRLTGFFDSSARRKPVVPERLAVRADRDELPAHEEPSGRSTA